MNCAGSSLPHCGRPYETSEVQTPAGPAQMWLRRSEEWGKKVPLSPFFLCGAEVIETAYFVFPRTRLVLRPPTLCFYSLC